MKKFVIAVLALLIMSFMTVARSSALKNEEDIKFKGKTYDCIASEQKDTTNFKLNLLQNSVALFGREYWKKGTKIQVKLKAADCDKDALIKAGIMKAEDMNKGWGYNDYGQSFEKSLSVDKDIVDFVVPEDGEYGVIISQRCPEKLCLADILKKLLGQEEKKYVFIEFEINKVFRKDFVK